ncbi:hypothetical protein BHM03_00011567 [Ensete ventricosum]|nr:hypothetical protein BHM03_00011567 [Ensete ventricosum]
MDPAPTETAGRCRASLDSSSGVNRGFVDHGCLDGPRTTEESSIQHGLRTAHWRRRPRSVPVVFRGLVDRHWMNPVTDDANELYGVCAGWTTPMAGGLLEIFFFVLLETD